MYKEGNDAFRKANIYPDLCNVILLSGKQIGTKVKVGRLWSL